MINFELIKIVTENQLLQAAATNSLALTLLYIVLTIISNKTNLIFSKRPYRLMIGLMFGFFACLSMTMPAIISEGVFTDGRLVIISFAGIFFGPIAAVFAAIPTVIFRALIGGTGVYTGITSIIIVMFASAGLGHYIRINNNGFVRFRWIVTYTCVVFPLCLLAVMLLPVEAARKMIVDGGVYILAINMLGAFLLGYMLSQDQKRRLMLSEMMKFRQKAEEAAAAKSVFMARMSHELRTPMNSIIGFTDLLRMTTSSDEQRYFLEQVKTAGRTMTDLISDILDFSSTEAGKTTLEMSPFNLVKMIESCSALISLEAHAKNLKLRIEIDPRCPEWVNGDELRLRQIIMNLLSNAVKFTDRGEVFLRAIVNEQRQQDFMIALSVKDTGIGIPHDKQTSIFNAFEQVDASLTRTHGGSGLGLSIAQQLTSLMGGQIKVESTEGVGSLFSLKLPLTQVESLITLDHQMPEIPAETEKKNILIVEDIAMNRDLVGSMLTKLGYAFETAENGAAGLQLLKEKKFDLVFMDIQMPVMNGYDATRAIREELNIDNDDLPVIALTAHALPEEIAKCFEAGMDDFLTKPVEFIELASKIDEWLDGGTDGWDITPRDGSSYENVPLLSETELKSFVGFVGNDRLKEAYEDFVNDNAARLMIIRTKQSDEETVRGTLHNMTSTSGNLGMKKLSLYTQHLLNQGIAKDRPAEDAELDLLDSIFRESCRTFERYMGT